MKTFADWWDVFCITFIMIFLVIGNEANSIIALIFVPVLGVVQYWKEVSYYKELKK